MQRPRSGSLRSRSTLNPQRKEEHPRGLWFQIKVANKTHLAGNLEVGNCSICKKMGSCEVEMGDLLLATSVLAWSWKHVGNEPAWVHPVKTDICDQLCSVKRLVISVISMKWPSGTCLGPWMTLGRTWLDVLDLDWGAGRWDLPPRRADRELWSAEPLQHGPSCYGAYWGHSGADVNEGGVARVTWMTWLYGQGMPGSKFENQWIDLCRRCVAILMRTHLGENRPKALN